MCVEYNNPASDFARYGTSQANRKQSISYYLLQKICWTSEIWENTNITSQGDKMQTSKNFI